MEIVRGGTKTVHRHTHIHTHTHTHTHRHRHTHTHGGSFYKSYFSAKMQKQD